MATKKSKAATPAAKTVEPHIDQQNPLFQIFNRWSSAKFETAEMILEAIKEFADESRDVYLPMPIALPCNLREAVEEVMLRDPKKLTDPQLPLREDILHRLRFYFKNQAGHIKDECKESAELWAEASYLLKLARTSSASDSYARASFSQDAVDVIFERADEAAKKQNISYSLKDKEPANEAPKRRTKSVEQKLKDFKEKYKGEKHLAEYLPAYRHSLRISKSFRQGKPAKKLNISASQADGQVVVGKHPIEVSKTSYMVWTVLRLVIESDDETVFLFKNWATQFKGPNATLLRYIKSTKDRSNSEKSHPVRLTLG